MVDEEGLELEVLTNCCCDGRPWMRARDSALVATSLEVLVATGREALLACVVGGVRL